MVFPVPVRARAMMTPRTACALLGVFAAAVRAVPYRSSFMLGLAPTEAEALAKLGEMLPLIEYINKVNEAFLESKGLPL